MPVIWANDATQLHHYSSSGRNVKQDEPFEQGLLCKLINYRNEAAGGCY